MCVCAGHTRIERVVHTVSAIFASNGTHADKHTCARIPNNQPGAREYNSYGDVVIMRLARQLAVAQGVGL